MEPLELDVQYHNVPEWLLTRKKLPPTWQKDVVELRKLLADSCAESWVLECLRPLLPEDGTVPDDVHAFMLPRAWQAVLQTATARGLATKSFFGGVRLPALRT